MIDTSVSYTDTYEATNSSVIDRIWYDSVSKDMYVGLKRGTIYGYEDVPADVYKAFADQEKLGGSLGQYWNEWIKPHMRGFGEIDENTLFTLSVDEQEPVEDSPVTVSLDTWEGNLDGLIAMAPVEDITTAQPVAVPEPAKIRNEYNVAFEFGDLFDTYGQELTVYSDSVDGALAAFDTAIKALGYERVVIKSVTLFFNQ